MHKEKSHPSAASTARIATPAVWLQEEKAKTAGGWLNEPLFGDFAGGITPMEVIVALTIMVIGWLASRALQAAMSRAFQRRSSVDRGGQIVAQRLVHYTVMLLTALVALNLAGVQLTSLFAAGAVFAVVIGFALQNLSTNFVSGVILMIERTITPDDILEVEGRVVKVVRMGFRATIVRTRDDEDLIIPNSLLVTSSVKNFTLRDSLYRLRCSVGVAYSSDLDRVRAVLEKISAAIEWRDGEKDPIVLLTDFGASSVNYQISVWIRDPWRAMSLKSKLHEAVWHALKEAGITIAFPQLDVHLSAEDLRTLRDRP